MIGLNSIDRSASWYYALEEVKVAFANLPDKRTPTKDDWQQLSRFWQQGLNQKIAYLEKLRDSLDGCIGCGCLSMKSCPIYNPEDILASENTGPVLLERDNN